MKWDDIASNDKRFSMEHLHPLNLLVPGITDLPVKVSITFGHHVFTDKNGSGRLFQFRGEERYFCPIRYDLSKELPGLIKKHILSRESYVTAYFNAKRNEQYFYLSINEYAVFMEVRKPKGTHNELKLNVVSAYEPDPWGKSGLPSGRKHTFKFFYVLARRLEGKGVLKAKK